VDCPTLEYRTFTEAFDWFNRALFGSTLPDRLITLQRKTGTGGYFSSKRFEKRDGRAETDEIALNPATFKHASDEWILSVLVHEMTRCWQSHYGRPTRNGYHNRESADKMEALGLMPSSSGQRGGKRTGQRMSHYTLPGGLFDVKVKELLAGGFQLTWQSREPKQNGPDRKNKEKHTCPVCGLNAWTKPGVDLLVGHPCHAQDNGQVKAKPADHQAPSDLAETVAQWFREMSLRFHPDRGGATESMQAINHAHARLRDILRV
jgi:hypothetical protein